MSRHNGQSFRHFNFCVSVFASVAWTSCALEVVGNPMHTPEGDVDPLYELSITSPIEVFSEICQALEITVLDMQSGLISEEHPAFDLSINSSTTVYSDDCVTSVDEIEVTQDSGRKFVYVRLGALESDFTLTVETTNPLLQVGNVDINETVNAPGTASELDTSFDSDGIVNGFGGDLLPDTQGRVLLFEDNGTLIRMNADWTQDNTFGSGLLSTPIASGVMARDSQDRIVVAAGHTGSASTVVARLMSDGTLDTSFPSSGPTAGLGYLSFNGLSININPQDINITTDDRIRMNFNADDDTTVAVVQLLADGSMDTAFDSDGLLIIPVGPDGSGNTTDLASFSNGDFFITTSSGGDQAHGAVRKYDLTGMSVAGTYFLIGPANTSSTTPYVTLFNDESSLASGYHVAAFTHYIHRRLLSGSLHATFNGGSILNANGSGCPQGRPFVQREGGVLLLAPSAGSAFACRLTTLGAFDASFGSTAVGVEQIPGITVVTSFGRGILQLNDGRLLISGVRNPGTPESFVVRIWP